MRVTFHGVRGSTPCQSDDIKRYGGNTSCVSVDAPGRAAVAVRPGHRPALLRQARCLPTTLFRGTCLLTHLHWDHVQGLPFFTPLLREGSSLDVYGPARTTGARSQRSCRPPSVRRCSRSASTNCPARFASTTPPTPSSRSAAYNVTVAAGSAPRADARLSRRVARSLDRLPLRSSAAVRRQLLGVARRAGAGRGVDLLIHDAQYTPARVRGEVDVGSLHHRLRRVAGCRGRGQAAGAVPPRPARVATTTSTACCAARSRPGAHRGVEVIAASEGLVVDARVAWPGDRRRQPASSARCSSSRGSRRSPHRDEWRSPVSRPRGASLDRRRGAVRRAGRRRAARGPGRADDRWRWCAGLLLVGVHGLARGAPAQGRRPPCACFGALTTKPIGWGNVVRNAGVPRPRTGGRRVGAPRRADQTTVTRKVKVRASSRHSS